MLYSGVRAIIVCDQYALHSIKFAKLYVLFIQTSHLHRKTPNSLFRFEVVRKIQCFYGHKVNCTKMGNNLSPRSEIEKDLALTKYIENTVRHELKFKETKDEVDAIRKAVYDMVDSIMEEVQRVDRRFEILRKIPVGSMAEETRIVKPDEFDFMIVLKELSGHNRLEIRHDCNTLRSFVHVEITDSAVREVWSDVCENGILKSTKSSKFIDRLICKLSRKSGNLGLRELFCQKVTTAVNNLTRKHHAIRSNHGTLTIKEKTIEIHGPAITPTFNWFSAYPHNGRNMEISIDLVPAIEVKPNQDIINENDTFSRDIFCEIEKTGRLHLVPPGRISPCTQGMCFHVACAETEAKLVKTMNSNHILCYKLFKDMFQTRNEIGVHLIVSYILKTSMLKHANDCNERENAANCFHKVLKELIDNCTYHKLKMLSNTATINISSVFFKETNIFLFKEVKQPVEVFGGTTQRLVKDVEFVRKEYPISGAQSKKTQNFRIRIQQHVVPTKRLVLCALSFPLSYIIPMILTCVPDMMSRNASSLSNGSNMASLLFFLIFIFSVLGLQTWLSVLETLCCCCRITMLMYACSQYMPFYRRFIVFITIPFFIIIGRHDRVQRMDAFLYSDLYSLWKVFIPAALMQWNANVLTWEKYIYFKELEKLIWHDKLFPLYYVASLSFVFTMNMNHRHSGFLWCSRLIGVFVCLTWLCLQLLWGDSTYILRYITGSFVSIVVTCVMSSTDLPIRIKVLVYDFYNYRNRLFIRICALMAKTLAVAVILTILALSILAYIKER